MAQTLKKCIFSLVLMALVLPVMQTVPHAVAHFEDYRNVRSNQTNIAIITQPIDAKTVVTVSTVSPCALVVKTTDSIVQDGSVINLHQGEACTAAVAIAPLTPLQQLAVKHLQASEKVSVQTNPPLSVAATITLGVPVVPAAFIQPAPVAMEVKVSTRIMLSVSATLKPVVNDFYPETTIEMLQVMRC
jgi:hypothetical protein